MILRRDIILSIITLLLPASAALGTALALLKPVPAALPAHPAKEFTERFAAAFAVPPALSEPEEPVPLPPVRPPDAPPPEPLPPPWAPSGAVARSSGLRLPTTGQVSAMENNSPEPAAFPTGWRGGHSDICARHGGWRVETARSWHCAYPARRFR